MPHIRECGLVSKGQLKLNNFQIAPKGKSADDVFPAYKNLAFS